MQMLGIRVFLKNTDDKLEFWSISHRKTLPKYKNPWFLKEMPAIRVFLEIM